MRGNARGGDVCAFEARARQREPGAELPAETRQEPTSADIGKQANTGFRHREDRAFGRYPVRAVYGQSDAAAHGDAVDDRQDRFRKSFQGCVHPVFGAEESPRLCSVSSSAFGQHADIPAGAEAARAVLMVDQEKVDGWISRPCRYRCQNVPAHRRVERVQGRGAHQRDAAEPAFLSYQHIWIHRCRPPFEL